MAGKRSTTNDAVTGDVHLRSVRIVATADAERADFPFTVPSLQAIIGKELLFDRPVTILVGENGSGKSTLLEGIALAAGSIAVGATPLSADASLDHLRRLSRAMRLTWGRRTHRGFFLRAEDFFGFARRMSELQSDLVADLAAIDAEHDRSDYSKALAKQPFARELHSLTTQYGTGLDARSHGEAFLALFQSRFVPDGLYLLDEPEAPLSPRRQLALIAMLHDMTTTGRSQFIIATHSPLLMAIPGARILSFDDGAVTEVHFDEIDHVALTRQFLDNPNAFLRHLWTGQESNS